MTEPSEAWLHEAVFGNYAERPLAAPPPEPRIWCYTDALSYAPGGTVLVSVNTNAASYAAELVRDGLSPQTVWRREGLAGAWRDTPEDCFINGCGWPV